MADLDGVADEWEDSKILRKYMRKTKKIVQPIQEGEDIYITAKTAGANYDLLAPLVIRLKDPSGDLKMHQLGDILKQSPSSTYLLQTIYSKGLQFLECSILQAC